MSLLRIGVQFRAPIQQLVTMSDSRHPLASTDTGHPCGAHKSMQVKTFIHLKCFKLDGFSMTLQLAMFLWGDGDHGLSCTPRYLKN